MASQLLRHARPLIVILGLAAAAIAAPTLAAATPAKEPTISSVQKQLGELAMQSSQLVETYNQAKITEAKRGQDAAATQLRHRRARSRTTGRSGTSSSADPGPVPGFRARRNRRAARQQQRHQLHRSPRHPEPGLHADCAGRRAGHELQGPRRGRRQAGASGPRRREDPARRGRHQAGRGRGPDQQVQGGAEPAQRPAACPARQDAQRCDHPRRRHVDDGKTTTQNAGAITISLSGADAKAQAAVKFALAQVGKPYVFGAAGPARSTARDSPWRRGARRGEPAALGGRPVQLRPPRVARRARSPVTCCSSTSRSGTSRSTSATG